ncbi:hypothetical protein BTM25_30590 [Actinomadura rubteroloni]|uniref:SalK n=1 Tax=Actinomadura rubteroloni TaxID=1926885 RepID=A0A2P4UHB5_9ACTN|nr:hypothetical protein [Actinomadura rubteroloni]POM24430.1 hypothetical protein BTM25_30590 [Actinomadura rubteroloni]
MDASYARTLWRVIEPVHIISYFAPESVTAAKEIGLRGYWMGYFAMRAAPLGPVGPGVVEATFHGFHPKRVRRAIPDAWTFAAHADVLTARSAAAAAALRRALPEVDGLAPPITELLRRAVEAADGTGRPLFAGNRDLPSPDDPVEALWQAVTALREHRGDGHVAILTAEGLDGPQSNVLASAVMGSPGQWLKDSRGYSDDEWDAAHAALAERGLLASDGTATEEGRAFRQAIEDRTDARAAGPYRALDDPSALYDALLPVAEAVIATGEIPFPNPVGVTRPA